MPRSGRLVKHRPHRRDFAQQNGTLPVCEAALPIRAATFPLADRPALPQGPWHGSCMSLSNVGAGKFALPAFVVEKDAQ
jgi:hypothetical protein